MANRRLSGYALRSFAVCGGAAVLLASTAALSGHSWGNYHWPTTFSGTGTPVSLKLGNNLTGLWGPYLDDAWYDWNSSAVLDLAIVQGAPVNMRRCAPAPGNIEICNDSYGNNGWLGVASISAEGDHIVSASVRVNDFYYSYPTYDTPAWRRFVMCQEVGHVFGLDHQDENFKNANLESCMDYSNDPSTNQHPNQHDYDQLAAIYGHADGGSDGGSTNVGPGCKGGPKKCANGGLGASALRAEIDLDQPSQWGRLISAHGPQETYELDFGQGRKIITHVLWTIERAEQGHGH